MGPILLSILLDNGEIRVLNFDSGHVIEIKNKPAALMEILPELRYYTCLDKGLVQSYSIISTS